MRQVVCRELGPPDRLLVEEVDPPSAGVGQVVVDIGAAGVNFVDALLVQGLYQVKPPLPFTPGGEVAGTLSQVGEGVEGWRVGDPVVAMTGLGGFAERVAVSARALVRSPGNLDPPRCASFIQSYATMLFAFTHRSRLEPGETVLVLGAGGGIGLAGVDLAVALGGKVIAAASTPEKLEAARAIGAVDGIAYEDAGTDLKLLARELSGGGVDLVVDAVGGRHAEPALRALRVMGRYLVIGFASGTIPSLPLNQVLLNNRTVVGVDWGGWVGRDPAGNQELVSRLAEMISSGTLHPAPPTVYALEDASRAIADLLGRRITGKAVVVP